MGNGVFLLPSFSLPNMSPEDVLFYAKIHENDKRLRRRTLDFERRESREETSHRRGKGEWSNNSKVMLVIYFIHVAKINSIT